MSARSPFPTLFPTLRPALACAAALAVFAQAPVRAAVVAVVAVVLDPSSQPGHGIRASRPVGPSAATRPWYASHDVATIRCDTAAISARAGALPSIHIASQFGAAMDNVDRACLVHALEWAPERRLVRWKNRQPSEAMYDVILLRKEDRVNMHCRFFEAASVRGGQRLPWRGKACRAADGIWKIT